MAAAPTSEAESECDEVQMTNEMKQEEEEEEEEEGAATSAAIAAGAAVRWPVSSGGVGRGGWFPGSITR